MSAIDRIGMFKGVIKDFGVTKTRKKELPQFTATLLATHLYNEATEEWEDWSEYDQTATAYFVLVTLNEQGIPVKCLNYEQVMLATGWKGETFADLAAMDLKDHPVQFRVQEDTYEGTTSLKINWIDGVDAEVGLKKLSGADLTDLDAKFGVPGNKPAAAPAKPKARAKAGKKAAPVGSVDQAPPAAPKPPARKTTPKPPAKVEEKGDPCTEEEAYNAIYAYSAAMSEPVPDEIRDDYWTSAVDEVAADSNNVTATEWPVIRDKTIEKLDIPF